MRTIYVLIIFWLLVLAVLLGVLVLGAAIWQEWFIFQPNRGGHLQDDGGARPEWPPEEKDRVVPPVLYQVRLQWAVDVGPPIGVAVDAKDKIYVAGQKRVQVFDPAGQVLRQWELKEPARCIAAAGADHVRPGAVYIGYLGRVEIRTDKGEVIGGWPLPGERSEPTSIALSDKEIYVADFAAKCVHRFDPEGKLLGQIGKLDRSRGYPGLIIPSPYCDVAIDKEGLLWVVNPGLLRLEAYRPSDGRLERFWGGEDLRGVAAFFGCCNPAHFCLLSDDRFVTVEKGRVRLKVYGPEGSFWGWLISPQEWGMLAASARFSPETAKPDHGTERVEAADVAADSQGRVIVLYLANSTVYLFDPIFPPPNLPESAFCGPRSPLANQDRSPVE